MASNTQDLDELEAKAKAATPGPWGFDGDREYMYSQAPHLNSDDAEPWAARITSWPADWPFLFSLADAEFIAAANPATVLALVAEVRRLRADLDFQKQLYQDAAIAEAQQAQAQASVVTRQRSEIDTLRAECDELKAIAQATRDTLVVIDEWLGMASTREAAVDSMRRLGAMLGRAGIQYTWKHVLDWRGSIIDELWQARFYSGPDGHWHYVPGDPPPVFGNAVGPELAEIVGRMEQAEARLAKAIKWAEFTDDQLDELGFEPGHSVG